MGCCCRSSNGAQVVIWSGAIVALMSFGVTRGAPDADSADHAGSGAPADTQPASAQPSDAKEAQPVDTAAADPFDVLGFTMTRIDGTAEKLDDYRGKVVLIVNTASKCGFTPQYEALEKIYRDNKDRGFVVLGFPANDFRHQEPGSNKDILEFCTSHFDVTFPMFEKVVVTGEGATPLYKKLAAQPEPIGGEPKWNFTKFLVDRTGRVRDRFEPGVKPDDERVTRAIERLLGEKSPAGDGG